MTGENTYIQKLKNRYLLRRMAELSLLAVGFGFLAYGIGNLLHFTPGASWATALLLAVAVWLGRFFQLGLHRVDERAIVSYLNRNFASLEDSTDLLLARPETLGPLQRLQQQKLFSHFEKTVEQVSWPQYWSVAFLVSLLGLSVFGASKIGWQQAEISAEMPASPILDSRNDTVDTGVPAELSESAITVHPPAYTRLGVMTSEDFNLRIPEGSRVHWELIFSGTPEKVGVIFSNGDSIKVTDSAGKFLFHRTIDQSGYYSLYWRDREQLKTTDFYKLEMVEDQAPRAVITNQEQFLEYPWQEEIAVKVRSELSDDYGLSEAYVVATVSKGSGESVKFREERLPFSHPEQVAGKRVQANLELNTRALGMGPGDELYYYIEVWDNRRPQRQSNRTETYFIQLEDTITQTISFEAGLGVDLMPEYFRSQRQIIIDSEKLLAEKKSIEKQAFDTRSNDLAHDQKVLRLRYGQFLGEEFESGIAQTTEPEETAAPENEEELLEKYGHAHDSDNEHNLVPEQQHEHDENPNPEEREASPIAAFAHSHDNLEEATFFLRSVKAKLRAALSMMWDAELQLRMNDPAASLPYQYRILKLLKEISNDSRIYVHRTGFDAPPIKEEKRLSGELETVSSSRSAYRRLEQSPYPAIERALPLIQNLIEQPPAGLNTSEQEILLAAGNELAAAAIEQPEVYLIYLSPLRALLDGQLDQEHLQTVQEAFWKLLPERTRTAGGREQTDHGLQDAFIKQLKGRTYQ